MYIISEVSIVFHSPFKLKELFYFKGNHSVKSVPIRNCYGLYFPAFGLKTDQNNSKYAVFLSDDAWEKDTL